MTKIFLSHLHTDHWGDLASLWAGGWTAGRPVPLEIWGPSGQTPDMGTKYAVEHFMKANNWDYQTRAYKISPVPGQIKVHEFDYKGVNAVIYNKNGIVVRSIPAIHAGDGPVSFIIEYAGLKLVFGGDTSPNKWFVKHTNNADFVIHEAFLGPAAIVQAGRFVFDSRDKGLEPRLATLDLPDGVWPCENHFECTRVCPRGIKITKLINLTKREIKRYREERGESTGEKT